MTLYIYNVDTNGIAAEYAGDTNQECEQQAINDNWDGCTDEFGWSYSNFGLI